MNRCLSPLPNAAAVVARARSQVGKPILYALGEGGRDPREPDCTTTGRCDCSGFAAWCVGIDRDLDNDLIPYARGWFETTHLWDASDTPFGFVRRKSLAYATPGDLLVYPDHDGHQGHVAIVVAVPGWVSPAVPPHPWPSFVDLTIVHCAVMNERASGGASAIAETTGALFQVNPSSRLIQVRWVL